MLIGCSVSDSPTTPTTTPNIGQTAAVAEAQLLTKVADQVAVELTAQAPTPTANL